MMKLLPGTEQESLSENEKGSNDRNKRKNGGYIFSSMLIAVVSWSVSQSGRQAGGWVGGWVGTLLSGYVCSYILYI